MDVFSPAARPRYASLAVFVAVLFVVGCRGNIGLEEPTAFRPPPTPTATPWPTPTPKPFRLNCDEITESLFFVSLGEKDWFVENCLVGPPVTIPYDSLPGIGARVMEIYTIDVAVCSTGLVSFTAFHRPNLERFYYTFRNFCSFVGVEALAFPPPAFACDEGELAESREVTLPYLNGNMRTETEVFCNPTTEPEPDATPPAPVGGSGAARRRAEELADRLNSKLRNSTLPRLVVAPGSL